MLRSTPRNTYLIVFTTVFLHRLLASIVVPMSRTPLLDRLGTRARQREGVSESRDDCAMKATILPEDLVALADTGLYFCLSYSLGRSFSSFSLYIHVTHTTKHS